mgnify:CR=1 FL=1
MITVPNRTDMSDESLALRTIDENSQMKYSWKS